MTDADAPAWKRPSHPDDPTLVWYNTDLDTVLTDRGLAVTFATEEAASEWLREQTLVLPFDDYSHIELRDLTPTDSCLSGSDAIGDTEGDDD